MKSHWHGEGRPAGGALMPTTSSELQTPQEGKGKHLITHTILSTLPPSRRREDVCLPQQQLENSPANEALLWLSQWAAMICRIPSFFQCTLCFEQPSNSPPFFYKRASSPLFLGHACSFAKVCLSWIVILCCPQINYFAGKVTDSFIFKVNSSCIWV